MVRPLACFVFSLLLSATCIAGVFDRIRVVPLAKRLAVVTDIYNNRVRLTDSAFAITSIKQLIDLSNELGDKPLQCFSISLLADQYARMHSANPQSTELHLQAIRMAEQNHLPLMMGICNYRLGRYYYSFKNYPFAFEYLLRADNYFNEIGYKEVPDIDEILYFMGSIYYETGNYDKAETYLLNIQKLDKVNNYVQKQSMNTLAMISKQLNDTARALVYFQKTLDIAIKQPDSAWIGISYSNIGGLYFAGQHYDKAYPVLEKGYAVSIAHKQWSDAYMDLLLMARIEIMQNKIAAAQDKIARAIALRPFYFTMMSRKVLYETWAQFYESTHQQEKTLDMQRRLMLVKDSLAISKDQQAYRKIQLRNETEKHLNDITKLEAEAKTSALQRNAVIIVLTLVVIVLLLLYSRYRMRSKNAAAILRAEKTGAEEKLKYARLLLQNFTENTRQKNELIEQFAAELERLKGNLAGDPLHSERLKNFEKLLQSTILTDSEWNSFRELFDKVHKGFLSRLQVKIPGLSLEDTRLVSLIRLNLSNQEIARMMGTDANTIQQSKQRLQQKIHPINDGINMEDIVQAI